MSANSGQPLAVATRGSSGTLSAFPTLSWGPTPTTCQRFASLAPLTSRNRVLVFAFGGSVPRSVQLRRSTRGLSRLRAAPVRVRCPVLDEPAVDQPAVGLPAHALSRVEGHERPLQLRQAIERHAGKVVMLEVIVGVEEHEVPEPVASHERAPLRRVGGID